MKPVIEGIQTQVLKTTLRAAAAALCIATAHAETPDGVPHPKDSMVFTLAGTGGNCAGCEWIAAEGPITERTPQDFETFLKSLGPIDGTITVLLNSNGGNLMAGLRLGEAIRAHKLDTGVARTVLDTPATPGRLSASQKTVQGGCYSSCAYAFLGGVNRSAESGELGFHQFHAPSSIAASASEPGDPDASQSAQQVMGLLVFYLREMSVDPTLLFFAVAADASSLFRPDNEAILKMDVTNVRNTPLFSGWSIEPYRVGAVVTGKLREGDNTQQLTLFCRTAVPGKVFLMASWQYPSASPAGAAADNTLMHTGISGSAVLIGGKPVRQGQGSDSIVDAHVDSSDRWFLTYALDARELSSALAAGGLTVDIQVPHSLSERFSKVSDGFAFVFEPPITGLATATRIAFKSCL